ncbi:MAG: queuosine precursor transporter [Thermoleophilia bacterium]
MTTHERPPGVVRTAATPSMRFPVLVVMFVIAITISNIAATKGVVLFPGLSIDAGPLSVRGLVTDGAFWLFPLSYVIGDVISEVYGFRVMRRVVVIGFLSVLAVAIAFKIAVALPAADFYDGQAAFEAVVDAVPRILAASLAGFVVGELLNSWVLVQMKQRTGERGLVARLMASTVVGELADTTIFCVIAASAIGISTGSDLLNFVVVGFVWKTLCEAAVLPISTAVIAWVKRREPSYFGDASATS